MEQTELALKYRPNTFAEVVGQVPTVQSLKEIIEKDKKLPNAILFSGSSGVGKTSLARVCAKTVGTDETNIIEIDAASHSGVDEARELIEKTKYTPMGANKTRVIIIDECHRLSRQGVEALLKSIEEPATGTTWILCTTEISKVLTTIRTRCHHYQLTEISTSLISKRLQYIVDQEKLTTIDKPIINFLAIKAKGSLRQAITYLSQSRGVKSLDEVKDLVKEIDDKETPTAIALCRLLSNHKKDRPVSWKDVLDVLKESEDEAESIRIVIVNYFNKIISNNSNPADAARLLQILAYFVGQSWNPSDKYGPLYIALASVIL